MFTAIANWLRLRKAQPTGNQQAADVVVVEDTHQGIGTQLVPYDENLLERSRTQWQFGDWQSLTQLQRETLQHHPDRAKLAALVAGAHQQVGDMSAARQFTRLAQDWGCSKKLISQVLIAGVHNTLGRASAIGGRSQQALQHFENAAKIAAPGADARLLVQARMHEELNQLDLPALKIQTAPLAELPPTADNSVQQLSEVLQKQHATLSEQIKQQNLKIEKVRQSLEKTVKSEMHNAAQQLEAFLGIQNFLNNGESLPGMHGWPISPDFALYIIELIDKNDYDLILEFGSGTSTVIIAKALCQIDRQQHGKQATVHVAFEHMEQYYSQTKTDLKRSDVLDTVRLILTPLTPYTAPNGKTYSYYACHSALQELAESFSQTNLKILMIVDGPPSSVGQHSRYPAVPSVLDKFSSSHIDVLLDDYIRVDEKETALAWLNDIENHGLSAKKITRKMEKDACLITISPRI
jgi:hypothetical protein